MIAPATTELMIRPAYGDDYPALTRLAALDSCDQVPPRPLLIAEVDGTPRAALSLADGSSVADPFYPSARLVELLRTQAAVAPPAVTLRERRRRLRRPSLVQG